MYFIDFDKLPTNDPKEWANFLHFGAVKREMLHNFSESFKLSE